MIYNVKIGKEEIEIDDDTLVFIATIKKDGIETALFNDTQDEMIVIMNEKKEIIDTTFWGKEFDNWLNDLVRDEKNHIDCDDVEFYEMIENNIDEHDLINHCSYELSEELESEYLKRIVLNYMMNRKCAK